MSVEFTGLEVVTRVGWAEVSARTRHEMFCNICRDIYTRDGLSFKQAEMMTCDEMAARILKV